MLKPFSMQGLHLFRGGLVCAEADAWGNAGFTAVLRGLTFEEIVGQSVAVRAATRTRLACGVAVRQQGAPFPRRRKSWDQVGVLARQRASASTTEVSICGGRRT